MTTHLIANLEARGLSAGPMLHAVRRATAKRAVVHETRTVTELVGVVEQILDHGCNFLILAGGDGTFMSGVSALAAAVERRGVPFPKIGLLPLGTVGTVARNFGPKGRPLHLLERWLAAPLEADAPVLVPRPSLRVRAWRGDDLEERVGFIVGTGLVARFFDVYEGRGAGGIPLAAQIVARVFVESFGGGPLARRILTPIPCELRVDGARTETRAVSLLLASVVRDLGLSMKVCYRAGEEPARFHLVASSLPPERLGPRAPLVVLGRSIGGDGHVDQLASEVDLRFAEGEGQFVLDGDLFRADRFTIMPGPILPIVGPG
jgi:diacylglycerol kinase family enzyme